MKSEKSFRKSVIGGFNTRDVVDYLAQMSKERREETEALRAGADKLRRERDAVLSEKNARVSGQVHKPTTAQVGEAVATLIAERDELARRVTELRNELDASREKSVLPEEGSEAGELEALRLQFYEMRKERDELSTRLDTVLAERESERAAIENFERERAAFESDRSAMLDTLTRREQEKAELAGERSSWYVERSELLEERQRLLLERDGLRSEVARLKDQVDALTEAGHARAQADTIRQDTARMIAETRSRFDELMASGRSSALEIVLELDRMRIFFARFTERFDEMEQGIAQLENDPRPRVREFVPATFEDFGNESETPE